MGRAICDVFRELMEQGKPVVDVNNHRRNWENKKKTTIYWVTAQNNVYCPTCGEEFEPYNPEGQRNGAIQYNDRCPECGQPVEIETFYD